MFKKILAVVLALVMALSVLAMNASAVTDVDYGDMNSDGNINASDALSVLQMSTGIVEASDYQLAIGDINADGKTNSSDALLILQLSTGLITSFNKSYDSTLKATVVDPVFANKAFTFSMAMSDKSVGDFDMIFSTDGKAKVIATVILFQGILPVEVRMLNKDNKNYQILDEINALGKPVEGTGVYCEIDENIGKMFDDYVKVFTADVIYGSTAKVKEGGKEYIYETYYNEAGAKFEYGFLNGTLEVLTVSNNGSSQTFDITNIEKGADTTRLVIPSNYTYDKNLVG